MNATKDTAALSPNKLATWIGTSLALSAGLLAILTVVGLLNFGSFEGACAYLRGDRLIPDGYTREFAAVEKGQDPSVFFRFANKSNQPIRILGIGARCTCVATGNLPQTVPAGGVYSLSIVLHTGNKKLGELSEPLTVYTDFARRPRIHLSIRGRVVENRSEKGAIGASTAPTGASPKQESE